MMLQNNLRVLMAKEKVSITELSLIVGISRNTISAIYHEKVAMIRYETIVTLCHHFKCTPNDLIVIPEKENGQI